MAGRKIKRRPRPSPVNGTKTDPFGMTAQLVTPDQATQWLERDKSLWVPHGTTTVNAHNRKLRDTAIARYARDMKAGRWKLGPDAICFAEDGITLINGQHRLWAVIEAGVPVEFYVARNVPQETQTVIDDGLPRNDLDAMKFVLGRTDVSNQALAIAKALSFKQVIGGHSGRLTRQEVLNQFLRHERAINFVLNECQRHVKAITIVPVLTPITRAWYSRHAHDKLAHFIRVLLTGDKEEQADHPIILLRNWLYNTAIGARRVGAGSLPAYAKTERALAAFFAGEKITTLVGVEEELFPLPGESRSPSKKMTSSVRKITKAMREAANADTKETR